jgi:hypothetical protein
MRNPRNAAWSLLLLLLVVTPASALPLSLGLRAGSSIPNLQGGGGNPLSSNWSSRVAVAFGAFADIAVTPALSIQTEINFSPQGGKRNGLQATTIDPTLLGLPAGSLIYANYRNTAKFEYLEIPLLAKWRVPSAHGFYLLAGPYAGLMLNARNVTSGVSALYLDARGTQPIQNPPGTDVTQDFGATTDVKNDLHHFNWGVQAGLGMSQPCLGGELELDVRGEYGLTNVQKNVAADGKNNTGSLVVSLGWSLPLARLLGH